MRDINMLYDNCCIRYAIRYAMHLYYINYCIIFGLYIFIIIIIARERDKSLPQNSCYFINWKLSAFPAFKY